MEYASGYTVYCSQGWSVPLIQQSSVWGNSSVPIKKDLVCGSTSISLLFLFTVLRLNKNVENGRTHYVNVIFTVFSLSVSNEQNTIHIQKRECKQTWQEHFIWCFLGKTDNSALMSCVIFPPCSLCALVQWMCASRSRTRRSMGLHIIIACSLWSAVWYVFTAVPPSVTVCSNRVCDWNRSKEK